MKRASSESASSTTPAKKPSTFNNTGGFTADSIPQHHITSCIRKKISESCKSLMFSNFLKKKILLEVSSRSPRTNLQMELSDVEMVLSMSLTELLTDDIKSRIEEVMVCNGCIENQTSQLGHECVTNEL
ncbi:hypothetical protein AVEN_97088-1 [Araneus ventricosus]|uniref:Uncharacterized protein n=1 Tax=Araneus ventricosus TaxID=182803 RepID=A0A4Y2EI64_ARAVE|nr:hypothetical protein AVEN_97088-1 [Araneus ventricosus]